MVAIEKSKWRAALSICAIAVLTLTLTAISPNKAQAAQEADALTIGTTASDLAAVFDIAGNSKSANYTMTDENIYIPVKLSKAGGVQLIVSVPGVKGKTTIALYNDKLDPLYVWGPNNPPAKVEFDFSDTKTKVGVIAVAIDKKKNPDLSKLKVTVKANCYTTTKKGTSIKSGKAYTFAQAKGSLFWKISLKANSKLTMLGAGDLCNSKKKAIQSSDAKGAYWLPKGTYYIRTKESSGIGVWTIKYKATKTALAAKAKNVSMKKAKNVKLKKKVTAAFTSAPKAKAHYYKFKLSKKGTIKVNYVNSYKGLVSYSIVSNKGKNVAKPANYTGSNKDILSWKDPNEKAKGTYSFLTKNKKGKLVNRTSVSLPKGTYYLKVVPVYEDTVGKYSFVVK